MTMLKKMLAAMAAMSMVQKAYTPPALKEALLDFGAELDRLRDELTDLRSKMEEGKQ
ncbi:hypothetical protein [Duganella sp. BJB476]|uniref:hypothetical protein n=1 Tax=Duganella sp. BJB476 TaxID=1871176 RepID=UPI0013140801|nr:hypothetical protein [Duganella sp. BJB476]